MIQLLHPRSPGRKGLARGLAALLALLAGGGVARAATLPIDWNLAVNVTPFALFDVVGPVLHPTSEDRLRLVLSGDQTGDCQSLHFLEPELENAVIRIRTLRAQSGTTPCTPGRFQQELTVEPLREPGNYTLEVHDEELVIWSQRIEVAEPLRVLLFRGGADDDAYLVSAELFLTDPRIVGATPRSASVVTLTPQAGYFWFFDPDNVEVTIKLLDGRPVTGELWLFAQGMTDLGFTLVVTRRGGCLPGSCPTETYVNPPGRRLNLLDGIF